MFEIHVRLYGRSKAQVYFQLLGFAFGLAVHAAGSKGTHSCSYWCPRVRTRAVQSVGARNWGEERSGTGSRYHTSRRRLPALGVVQAPGCSSDPRRVPRRSKGCFSLSFSWGTRKKQNKISQYPPWGAIKKSFREGWTLVQIENEHHLTAHQTTALWQLVYRWNLLQYNLNGLSA